MTPATNIPVLSKTQLAVFGFVLAAINLFSFLVIDASTGVHTGIAVVTITLGAMGATASDAALLVGLIPHQLALYLTLAANIASAINAQISMPNVAHALIAAALALVATVGIKPAPSPSSTPPSASAARRSP